MSNANFDAISDGLNSQEGEVKLVTLSGVKTIKTEEGTTVEDFKYRNNLENVKIVNSMGVALKNTDIIPLGEQLFISTPKKNG